MCRQATTCYVRPPVGLRTVACALNVASWRISRLKRLDGDTARIRACVRGTAVDDIRGVLNRRRMLTTRKRKQCGVVGGCHVVHAYLATRNPPGARTRDDRRDKGSKSLLVMRSMRCRCGNGLRRGGEAVPRSVVWPIRP